jgi:hypothetical protein
MVSDKKNIKASLFGQFNQEIERMSSVTEIGPEVDKPRNLNIFISQTPVVDQ